MRLNYATDLSDKELLLLEPFFTLSYANGGRPLNTVKENY
jgi:hypothetical protein